MTRASLASVALAAALALAGNPAQAATITWNGTLAPEAAGATGTGSFFLSFNTVSNVLRVESMFSGLSGLVTVAHIHCCTAAAGTGGAGVAVDAPSLDVDTGVSFGSIDQFLDLDDPSNFGSGFLAANGGTTAGAIAALLAGLSSDTAYLNIHSTTFGGGEIRGFAVPAGTIPEPSSLMLAALGVAGLGFRRWRSQRTN